MRKELLKASDGFRTWYPEAVRSGRIQQVDDDRVSKAANAVVAAGHCLSNDQHVIALAQVSGARLLYADDCNLQKDFRNQVLIKRPRGSVYSTMKYPELQRSRRRLLQRNTCRQG